MDTTMLTSTSTRKFHLQNTNPFIEGQVQSAIRKGTVKSFIKKGINSVQFFGMAPDQSRSLSGHLLQLKGSCSHLNLQIKNKEHDTTKCKDEAGFVAERSRKIKQNRQQLEEKIKALRNQLDMISMKKNSAMHSYKTYEHILDRMKKDDITAQIRKNQMEAHLDSLQKKFRYLQTKNFNSSEMERLAYHGLKQAREEHQEQAKHRKVEFENINQIITKKKENMERNKERQKKTQKIQELAADDLQDAQILRLKKFLIVQMFLKSLMKSKISKLKIHYQPYELAFYKIKSHTNVRDSVSLKSEFFNFEENYNQNIAWVKHLEDEIKEKSEEKKNLKAKLGDVMNNQFRMMELFEEQQEGQSNFDKEGLNKKSMHYELSEKKIKDWLEGQMKKLKVLDNDTTNLTLSQCFQRVCIQLKEKKYRKIPKQKQALPGKEEIKKTSVSSN